jgi:hypothetical protein
MTVEELKATHNIGFTCERARPDEDIWECRIVFEDRGMTIYHLSPEEPTLAAVLKRLVVASRQHVSSKIKTEQKISANRDLVSFHHWCALYGHDPESRSDRKRYIKIRQKAEQLKYVLGIHTYRRLINGIKKSTKNCSR